MISSYPFLSAYGKEICRLLIDGVEISIPKSTEHLQRFVMLRDGDQFETSAGRWEIQRDDEQGTIQNSMRPPPLPEQPVEGNLEPMEAPEEDNYPCNTQLSFLNMTVAQSTTYLIQTPLLWTDHCKKVTAISSMRHLQLFQISAPCRRSRPQPHRLTRSKIMHQAQVW